MKAYCWLAAAALFAAGCGSADKSATAEPPKKEEPVKPRDESRRFPQAGLTGTEVVAGHLLGKDFMPGGTLAHYTKGKAQFDMFVAKLATPTDAAILLLDWDKALTGAKLVPSFGGYTGLDGTRPVFVFSKGPWIAGIAGLPQKDADTEARVLATRID